MTVHVYRAHHQPAHRYCLDVPEKPCWVRTAKRSLVWCDCCERYRWAQNATVQVYYDGVYFSCRPGRGCKS